MDPLYTVELFGGLRVVAHFDPTVDASARTLTRFRTHQAGSLLAYLAYHAGKMCSREVLINMLWPEASEKSGRARLSNALSSLRSQLEPPGVATGSVIIANQTRIGVSRLVSTDTAQFEAAIDAAERHDCSSSQRKIFLDKALRVFDKRLMPGYYDTWIVEEQERLGDRARKSLLYLANSAEDAGEVDAAIAYARRAVFVSGGFCEDAEDILNRLGVSVNTAAATARFASARRSETAKYEVPKREVKLGRQQPPHPKPVPPSSASVMAPSGGSKAAAVPVLPVPLTRFFGRDAEYRTLTTAITNPSVRLITLTGAGGAGKSRLAREAALRWRQASVADGGDTLSEVSAVLPSRLPDIFLIDLTTESDPFRLPFRVAAALNLAADEMASSRNAFEVNGLAPFIRAFDSKNPLLILDNIEHLLPRATDWIEALLEHVPHLTCLTTSRVRLRIPGEHELRITPLPTPPTRSLSKSNVDNDASTRPNYTKSTSAWDPEALLRNWPSVALFVDRAEAARPGFALTRNNVGDVVALVKYLEGLPLSLELAAARVQVMTPAQMLRQSPNRFSLLTSKGRGAGGHSRRDARHSSLHETIAWSISLLPEDLQTFYAQMSVFRDGWNDEAAEAVSGNPLTLDALAVLNDASLIRTDTTYENEGEVLRFNMLESLREFAAKLLDYASDSDEDVCTTASSHPEYAQAAERHGRYFASMVALAAPHLQGTDSARYLDELGRENENIKAAIRWATAHDDSEITQAALVLAADLGPYWYKTGRVQEGRDLLKAMMVRSVRRTYRVADAAVITPKLVRAVNSLGALAMQQRDFPDALRWYRTALFLERREPSPDASRDASGTTARTQYLRRRASVLNNFAIVKKMTFDHVGAVRAYQESLALWRELGETVFVGSVLSNLGNIAVNLGHWDAATEYMTEAISIFRAAKNTRNEAVALNNLAEISYRRGNFSDAGSLYRQSLRIFHVQKDSTETAKILFQLGLIAAQYDIAIDRSEQMLQIAWATLTESGTSVSDEDKSSALRILGDSWMQPTLDSQDLHAALDVVVMAVLGENRFASAPGLTAQRPTSFSLPLPAVDANRR